MTSVSRFLGCMYGLAIGDALGYPIEFQRAGPFAVTGLESALYSDDTQMSLATARGLISSKEHGDPTAQIYRSYVSWLAGQSDPSNRRAPGNTCISALASGRMGTLDRKLNNSKGCGGVMRVAPIGLACIPKIAFQLGVEAAAITHSHPSGYLSAGFLSELVASLSLGRGLNESLDGASETLAGWEGRFETADKVAQARKLARGPDSVEASIALLGGGWVGEEALAIAVYCALRFQDDLKAGVLASVKHGGDSDSTGCICGAILGTLLGIEAIPSDWVENVENSDLLRSTATRLHDCFADSRMASK